jgi:hypothetical protein
MAPRSILRGIGDDELGQREPMALLWEKAHDVLSSCVKKGVEYSPLPSPPHLFEEMPAIEPSGDIISQQAIGVNSIDKAGFKRIIENYLSTNTPDHVKRAIDEERALDNHILNSIELLIDKFLIARITEWFRASLDCEIPDTDRWWWAISLFVGVCIERPNAVIDEGFHLIESIALGSPPGNWQTKAVKGPHLLDWKGEADDQDVNVHVDGAIAAAWLLDIVENDDVLIVRWWPEIINRNHLYIPLRMQERLSTSLSINIRKNILLECLPHLIIQDLTFSKFMINEMIKNLNSKEMAKIVSLAERISYNSIELALLLIDHGFEFGGDSAVLSQGALSAIATHDERAFLSRIEVAAYHPDIRSRRRFVQSGLRILMQIDPIDSHEILLNLLIENDEVSRTRLRRFAIEMCTNNPDIHAKITQKLIENNMETNWLN